MQKITVVDKEDNVVGAEWPEVVSKKGLIHRIIRVILVNSKKEIYLQKRGPNKKLFPNRWDQSVGGHVDEGEDYLEAAYREMKEELGVEGVKLKEVARFYQDYEDNLVIKRFNVVYEATYDGEIKVEEGESSGGGWYSKHDIKRWMASKPKDFVPGCMETFKRYWAIKK